MNDVLSLFQPATARWFRESFAGPTPPQLLGWPEVAAGKHTLILAPTGSGKTLAAFLYAIDELTRWKAEEGASEGVHTLYLSPLKALAHDIERNLDEPLSGIRASAAHLGLRLPEIRVASRTGDTASAERRKMVRHPPDLLVTTPESLHLLLTSTVAREMLRTVRYVIVDEIHALCPSKRGSFLALLLERLDELAGSSPVRIGLSATQRPLEEVATFLGGYASDGAPRPVSIVDAGTRKDIDLEVTTPVEDMTDLPVSDDLTRTIWPSITATCLDLVESHTSTLIFGNSRRVVERLAAEINELAGAPLVRAHHGSVSKEERHRIESELKAGRMPGLVATASMELGIDVGAIDLVCQVEAPFSVASGLQRVGRAGHLVRATSVGRMIPKTRADLLVMAATARGMLRGEISAIRIPRNPLDILAQQIVAMVAMDEWTVERLYERVRRAAPYRELPWESFLSVVDLVAGRYRAPDVPALRPRVSWERTSGRLFPMPGSRHAVLLNGGAIPDTGQYAMVLGDRTTRIGELDEEFVFERRLGDTFILGSGCWRIVDVTHDRVVVEPAESDEGMMPFWKGEGPGRDAEFGERFGAFLRACEARLGDPGVEAWLAQECALSAAAARNLAAYVSEQRRRGGVIPNDRRILIDVFRNEAGDLRMSILSPFGRAFHLTLLLALQRTLRDRGIAPPDAIFSGDGILLRPGGTSPEAVIDAIERLRSEDVVDDVVAELESTSFFAMRFRRNAGRALLLPRTKPGRRTPLWLQRLRAHDLLRVASEWPGFPIVAETYREIVEDELPLDAVRRFLEAVKRGEASFAVRRDPRPCPFTAQLLLDFTGKYLYEEDRPVAAPTGRRRVREDVRRLLGERISAERLFDLDAVRTMDDRLQGRAAYHRARDGAEVVELLRRIGDLTWDELADRCEPGAAEAVDDLIEDGRVARISVPGAVEGERLVAADDAERYRRLNAEDLRIILRRFVASHAVVDPAALAARYPMAAGLLDGLRREEGWLDVERADGTVVWSDAGIAAGIRRRTLSGRRRQVRAVAPEVYAAWLLADHRCTAPVEEDELPDVMERLIGVGLPFSVWDDVLSIRIRDYHRGMLERLVRCGELAWSGVGGEGGRRIAFTVPERLRRGGSNEEGPLLGSRADVMNSLVERGASFLHQIASHTGHAPSDVAVALWDLIWTGHVTNDSLDAASGARPNPDRWASRRRGDAWGGGRWAAVREIDEQAFEDAFTAALDSLLVRYGLVNRQLVGRSALDPEVTWALVYPKLSRREWIGRIERGLFVSGFAAPQFADRRTIEEVTALVPDETPILVNTLDPACIHGDLVPIETSAGRYVLRHHPANYLVLVAGRPMIAVEGRAERLVSLAELGRAALRRALSTLPRLVEGRDRPAAIRVKTWNGRPVGGSVAGEELERIGFVREDREMILYRSYGEERVR